MRAVIQRVSRARVTVDGVFVGACGPGPLVLLGVAVGDEPGDAERLAGTVADFAYSRTRLGASIARSSIERARRSS